MSFLDKSEECYVWFCHDPPIVCAKFERVYGFQDE
jgi:hypothetical protein